MHTRILSIDSPSAQQTALRLLQNGSVIVVPTDTVYGVTCLYDKHEAIEQLFEVKQRPLHKAIPVLIGEQDQISRLVATPLSPTATLLAERFWPGPLTLILPARAKLSPALTAGGTTVGVRMPDHDTLRSLMQRAGPLAATSANRSGEPEACSAQEALDQLGNQIPLILSDDESTTSPHRPLASTVVDVSGECPAIVRMGPIAVEVTDLLSRAGHLPC
jgi:L-threonylcarbamoyladenylate synthase